MDIKFQRATVFHQEIIMDWLDKLHVKEFWDNSKAPREDWTHLYGKTNKSITLLQGGLHLLDCVDLGRIMMDAL